MFSSMSFFHARFYAGIFFMMFSIQKNFHIQFRSSKHDASKIVIYEKRWHYSKYSKKKKCCSIVHVFPQFLEVRRGLTRGKEWVRRWEGLFSRVNRIHGILREKLERVGQNCPGLPLPTATKFSTPRARHVHARGNSWILTPSLLNLQLRQSLRECSCMFFLILNETRRLAIFEEFVRTFRWRIFHFYFFSMFILFAWCYEEIKLLWNLHRKMEKLLEEKEIRQRQICKENKWENVSKYS